MNFIKDISAEELVPMCLAIAAALTLFVLIWAIIVGGVYSVITSPAWQAEAIYRGYGEYCADGKFAWKGECGR